MLISLYQNALIPVKEDYATFRRVYETPILKSRAPDCSAKESDFGKSRSEQVHVCQYSRSAF